MTRDAPITISQQANQPIPILDIWYVLVISVGGAVHCSVCKAQTLHGGSPWLRLQRDGVRAMPVCHGGTAV